MTSHKPTPKFCSGYFTKLVLLPTYLSLMKKETATYSSILAWEIPWTEEPDGLQPMASQVLDATEQLNHHHHSSLSFYQSVILPANPQWCLCIAQGCAPDAERPWGAAGGVTEKRGLGDDGEAAAAGEAGPPSSGFLRGGHSTAGKLPPPLPGGLSSGWGGGLRCALPPAGASVSGEAGRAATPLLL